MLKIKDDIDLTILRNYGFELGSILKDNPVYQRVLGSGYEYQWDWWHLFSMDPDNPDKILYADELYDQPLVTVWVDTRNNALWVDATPSCTYHIGMDELDLATKTIYQLTKDNIIEWVEE